MGAKNLHDKAFDDTTITKLEIFENYTKEWLPTFIMKRRPRLFVFDFFAGPGFDINNVPGSPIRILQKIVEQTDNLINHDVKITIFLNEYEPNKNPQRKFELLKSACQKFLNDNPTLTDLVEIHYINEDFEILFHKLLPFIKRGPALVFLDQNGIKFTSDRYIMELEKIPETDFLYFISSSYFWRFGDTEEFRMHLNIDMKSAKADPYKYVHKNIIGQLRKKLPEGSKLKLYPFSLKRGQNIHGIIFGASHIRAVDKFLSVAWAKNTENGEANFDIHDDALKDQLDIFEGKRLKRIEAFQEIVRRKVTSREIRNNKDLYDFTLQEGHIGRHASDILRLMKKNGEVQFNGTFPLVTYDNVYKKPRLLEYFVTNKN